MVMRNFLIFLIFFPHLGIAATANSHGTILLYHHVATDTPSSTSISPGDFKSHLDYLKDNNFSVLPLNRMIEALKDGESLPDKSVAITFDDGYTSIYDTAFPLLQEYKFPFTLFISTGPIDRGQVNYMKWDQIREMANAGVMIANHMVEHPYMLERETAVSDTVWLENLANELLFAEKRILAETGQSHRYLAYPYGEFDTNLKTLLAENNFIGLAQNSGAIGVNSDFLALPRFPLASIYADLNTAKTKMDTKAFNVEILQPASPVTNIRNPRVTLKFNPGNYNVSQIGCFANSRPLIMEWIDAATGVVEISSTEEYRGRRWRYICTAPVPGEERFYWYSIQWIMPN